jgi:hypothetical protein
MKTSLLAIVGSLLLGIGSARGATRVELYTMGPGDDLFEAFGHGALCVIDAEAPSGACWNYGTADFRDPPALIWRFLRARATFWVSRAPLPLMLEAYAAEDRTIYRQVLDLPAAAADRLAARLRADEQPDRKYYRYNHYTDNCTTRLRDQLDAATGGRLAQGADAPFGKTWRDVTLVGFARDLRLLLGMEVLVGRPVDAPMTMWDAMFLPDVLRTEVARRLGAPIEVVNVRRGPLPHHDPLAGRKLLLAASAVLTLLLAVAAIAGPWRLALGLAGLVIGLIGTLAVVVAAVALMPELRRNEVLLVCLPTDLALVALRGRPLLVYLSARLVLLAAVVLGLAAGALVQPMWAAVALVAGPFAVATLREARALLRSDGGGMA